jgi:hypothetical protein
MHQRVLERRVRLEPLLDVAPDVYPHSPHTIGGNFNGAL